MGFDIEEGKLSKYYGNDSKVVIPEDVTRIATAAFDGNDSIETLVIPATNPEYEWDAFKGMKKLNLVIAHESSRNYWKAYKQDHPVSVVILPDDMEEVPEDVMSKVPAIGEEGHDLFLVKGIKTLHFNALWEYSTEKLVLPDSITLIEREAFVGGKYDELVIPRSVFMINSGALTNTTIRKLTIQGEPIINEGLWGDMEDMANSVLEIDAPEALLTKYADIFKKTGYAQKIERDKKAAEEAIAQQAKVEEWKKQGLCQYDGGKYNLFKSCKICGRKRDY